MEHGSRMPDRQASAPALAARPIIRAAEYVRMSTEHQKYSTENQSEAIRAYAVRRGMEIVRTYADAGKSGLRLDGRDALKKLLADVEGGAKEFDAILVYDISRWGRFQDADESAYYEYRCKRAGISVQYCAEQFENDGSPVSTIVKGVKRAMAGEYSRELSAKVFTGQCRLIELGFRQGGAAGFGLRRQLVDQTGAAKEQLDRGQHKSIQTDRVILIPGPDMEIETVRWIYKSFVIDGRSEVEIAADLNSGGILSDLGRPWTRGSIHQILINEKYVGNNVWNRASFKLKRKHVVNNPEMWVRSNGAFEAIVDRQLYDGAQAIIAERSYRMPDEAMLSALDNLLQRNGHLSGILIDETSDLPSSSAYRTRFGSLLRAYTLIGYTPDRDYRYIEINRALRALHPSVVTTAIAGITEAGAHVEVQANGLLRVNDEFTVSIAIARCIITGAGSLRWRIHLDAGMAPDITIAVRMSESNNEILDYYLLPSLDMATERLRLTESNGVSLDCYRFEDLDYLFEMSERISLREVA